MIEIRRGKPCDYPVLLEQLVQSFRERNPCHQRFEVIFPDVVNPSAEAMEQWHLAFVDGKLAAGVELIPRNLKMGDAELSCGGIGNVHCWQPYRGTGCMSALLNHVIDDMNQKGWSLGLLGGNRARYGNFGWEYAGVMRMVSVTGDAVRFEEQVEAIHANELRDYQGSDEDAAKMWEVFKQKPTASVYDSVEAFKASRSRPGSVTYIDETEDTGFSYISVKPGEIVDYAGSCAGVERILRFLLRSSSWSVALPPMACSGETEHMFMHYAGNYSVSITSMVRVNSMCRVLNSYMPYLRRRLANWTGERIIELDDGEKVSILKKGEKIVISDTCRASNIRLTRREAAQLFFGPFMPDLGCQQDEDFWRLVFPLPLFWGRSDRV